jgi:hypothetical protein
MTNDQIFREMQEADKIRASIEKKSEENVTKEVQDVQKGSVSEWYGNANKAVKDFANWGKEIGEMVKEGPAGQAFDATRITMADINRRVVEEPWFGKPVQDILFDRQQNPIQRDRNVDQDAGKAEPSQQGAVHGQPEQQQGTIHGQEQEEQTTIHGKNEPQKEQDNSRFAHFSTSSKHCPVTH